MIDPNFWIHKVTLLLVFGLSTAGVAAIFLRRHAVWCLIGQVTSLKAVAAASFLVSRDVVSGREDLLLLSLVAIGMIPLVSVAGMLVLHRCGRFGGTLEYDEEDSLRN